MALQRIVKMTFKAEHCKEFEVFFEEIKDQIASQPGCFEVNLLKDQAASGIYFTHSFWENQASLDAYRTTDLFAKVWPKVKDWFADKPEAWSTDLITKAKK